MLKSSLHSLVKKHTRMSSIRNVLSTHQFANALRILCALGSLHDRSLSYTSSTWPAPSSMSFAQSGTLLTVDKAMTAFNSSNTTRHTTSPHRSDNFSRACAVGSQTGRRPTLSCATSQRMAKSDTTASSAVMTRSSCVTRSTRSRELCTSVGTSSACKSRDRTSSRVGCICTSGEERRYNALSRERREWDDTRDAR